MRFIFLIHRTFLPAVVYPTNISGQKLTGVASFMLPLGLDYVKSNVNVMLMVAELNY